MSDMGRTEQRRSDDTLPTTLTLSLETVHVFGAFPPQSGDRDAASSGRRANLTNWKLFAAKIVARLRTAVARYCGARNFQNYPKAQTTQE
jgi:hypothetical protein